MHAWVLVIFLQTGGPSVWRHAGFETERDCKKVGDIMYSLYKTADGLPNKVTSYICRRGTVTGMYPYPKATQGAPAQR